jgi:hypothetical protein
VKGLKRGDGVKGANFVDSPAHQSRLPAVTLEGAGKGKATGRRPTS